MPSDAQIRAIASPFAGRHYTVDEIAELWKLSRDKVRELFAREPGVIALGETRSTSRKRRYVSLRVPEQIVERVHRRLTIGVPG